MKPNYRELEGTAAYQRGAELYRMRWGPPLLPYLDQHLERSSPASVEFERVNGREPKAGDRLSYQDVAGDRDADFFAAFIDAWKRRLPGLVCPLELENGELYFRTLGNGSNEVWQEKTEAGPQARWGAVQRDAAGNESGNPEEMPAVLAVWFQGW